MKTVLVTAFEPFGGEQINPSWEIAQRLDGAIIDGAKIVSYCLPCTFSGSLMHLERAIQHYQPSIVIALGQAGGRSDITPERVAINWCDARIPDNIGDQPCDVPVILNAPAAYFTSLPIKAITAALQQNGVPSSISYTAGTFVCNQVFFGLQHLAKQYHITQSGFIHIPYLPEQAAKIKGAPSMGYETLLSGLEIIIQTTLKNSIDCQSVGGELH